MAEMEKSIADFQETMEVLSKESGEAMHHFRAFMDCVLAKKVLDTKTKELIALGTAITARCKYCIAIHVKKAIAAGAPHLGHAGGLGTPWGTSIMFPHAKHLNFLAGTIAGGCAIRFHPLSVCLEWLKPRTSTLFRLGCSELSSPEARPRCRNARVPHPMGFQRLT
jgi:AhpD family alkylhydroperoxidase